ncbi:hypothetical protein P170DRAFT_431727 [Aspergillus steynii IBT 23096]|uniref:NAD(P)-binding protein n=1 Tax=Aspergillus steynii IBT 23096 TaxID=1392250 RepID=A0A2I2GMD9_9EURO|nr:uncharacterized protein P170DRAFT_431727 [Aspergillus steynii IBT 23096]PLB54030.1 hypothetical protein P170DRAFT_431727 [Aspergillus steynii IBT 23096]
MTTSSKQSIVIAGASDVAKYLIEELIASNPSNPPQIGVLTRSLSNRPWFTSNPHISLHVTEYSAPSIQSILNQTKATALFSLLHSNDPSFYNTAHEAMLTACRNSDLCKRFVPSDYGGDIDRFPSLPRFYDSTHRVFRETISNETEVEWTFVNGGWFMDYIVQGNKVDPTIVPYKPSTRGPAKSAKPAMLNTELDTSKVRSYMKPLPGIWPLDLDTFTATKLGTGEEPIGWTSARDVARALVKLLDAPSGSWEKHTYVAGQIGTWNEAIGIAEEFYGRKFDVTEKMTESILLALQNESTLEPVERAVAYMDEWNVIGASAVPMDRVLEHRERFFSGVKFRGLRELLEDAFVGESEQMV